MKRIISYLLLFMPLAASASDYVFPVKVDLECYAASFGEFRRNHFHGGVDIKTDGVTGRSVVAAADGYVYRILVDPTGFGRALYIAHPAKNTMTVYGHLKSFRKDIEKYAQAQRWAEEQNEVDFYPPKDMFPVKAGDLVARSGNSGASKGPHLHFELRSLDGKQVLNPVKQKLLSPKDSIPPRVLHLFYVPVDTLRGVPVTGPTKTYEIKRDEKGIYRPLQSVSVGRNGYFVVTVKDPRNDTWNHFGIWRAAQWVDGRKNFEYIQNGYPGDHTRSVNAVSYYPIQIKAKSEAVRMARAGNAPLLFYSSLVDDGAIMTKAGQVRKIRMEFEDECSNISYLEFSAKGVGDDASFRATDSFGSAPVAGSSWPCSSKCGALTVDIPVNSLCEPAFLVLKERSSADVQLDTVGVRLSPVYSVMDSSTPLQGPVSFRVKVDVPEKLRSHVALALRVQGGKFKYLPSEYSQNGICASSREFGDIVAVADTVAPRIVPKRPGVPNLSKYPSLRFSVRDNFSGVEYYRVEVDGRWVPADYHIGGSMTVDVSPVAPISGKKHSIRIEARDGCGNIARWSGSFIR